ncbi:MAG: SpoIIE family protein phosphatase [Verrucomicrobiota bacterium]
MTEPNTPASVRQTTAITDTGVRLTSNQLLKLIDDNVADLIAVINSDKKRIWHNEAYCRTLGYGRQDLAEGHSQVQVHEEDLPKVQEIFEMAMKTGKAAPCAYRMQRKDGEWIHLESNAKVVDLEDQGRCLILVARDVSERVRLEKQLRDELAEAADYVRSLLPPPIDKPVRAHWRFVPSTSLGGDAFFYEWVDDRIFRFGLLDVCGHGMGAALLSISAVNCLRARGLQNTDFHNPAEVLSGMNKAFPMEEHGERFFTMWYGVYDREKRELTYASAGHPAAILTGGAGGQQHLETVGGAVGIFPDMKFSNKTQILDDQAILYLFSDGVFELQDTDGREWPIADFMKLLEPQHQDPEKELERIMTTTKLVAGSESFDDDYSMLRLTFL